MWGEAMEVPLEYKLAMFSVQKQRTYEMVLVAWVLPIQVLRMFNPGAKISTHSPWLEK